MKQALTKIMTYQVPADCKDLYAEIIKIKEIAQTALAETTSTSPRLPESAEWVRQYEAVQDIIFEAAISKAFDNRELIRPSIRHYFDGNNVNGQFLLTIKKLMRWTEKKVIEAVATPPKPNNE